MKIKFSKKELIAAGLDTFNEFKIVFLLNCNQTGEACIIREYLVYRMYERLSPYHLKAHLAKIQFKDSGAGMPQPVVCMLLEDKEETQARLGGTFIDRFDIKETDLKPENLATAGLFQYMIGNTDWEIMSARNIRMLKMPDQDQYIPIPYDFDFAGLVNATYAVPNPDLGLKSTRERRFMIGSLSRELIQKASQAFAEARAELNTLCKHHLLSEKESADMIQYLDGFFREMEKSKDVPKGYRPSK